MKKTMLILSFVLFVSNMFAQEYKPEQIKDLQTQDPRDIINNMINEKMGPTVDELCKQGQMIKNLEEKIKNLPEEQKKDFLMLLQDMKDDYNKKFIRFQESMKSEFANLQTNQDKKINGLESKLGNLESSIKGHIDDLVKENSDLRNQIVEMKNSPRKCDTLVQKTFSSRIDTVVVKEKSSVNNNYNYIAEKIDGYDFYFYGEKKHTIEKYMPNFYIVSKDFKQVFQILPGSVDVEFQILSEKDQTIIKEKNVLEDGTIRMNEKRIRKNLNELFLECYVNGKSVQPIQVEISGGVKYASDIDGKVCIYPHGEGFRIHIQSKVMANLASKGL